MDKNWTISTKVDKMNEVDKSGHWTQYGHKLDIKMNDSQQMIIPKENGCQREKKWFLKF